MKLFYKAVVGTATATCVAVTAVSPDVSFERSPTFVVRNTAVSSNRRFVFAVGLEGTGHHYFVTVQDHLFRTSKHLVHLSSSETVYRDFYTIYQSMPGNLQLNYTEPETAREAVQKLANRGVELQFPGTVVSLHSRNSYSMFHGPNKALKYVDLRFLAELAEEEGMDFRVLYLWRSFEVIVIANIVHRDFQI